MTIVVSLSVSVTGLYRHIYGDYLMKTETIKLQCVLESTPFHPNQTLSITTEDNTIIKELRMKLSTEKFATGKAL